MKGDVVYEKTQRNRHRRKKAGQTKSVLSLRLRPHEGRKAVYPVYRLVQAQSRRFCRPGSVQSKPGTCAKQADLSAGVQRVYAVPEV